jgi:hypothetical protein
LGKCCKSKGLEKVNDNFEAYSEDLTFYRLSLSGFARKVGGGKVREQSWMDCAHKVGVAKIREQS